MPSSCKEIRADLAKCMQKSDCVLINRHTVSECLMDKELFASEVPDECHRLRRSFYNCRRGMIDMRLRFRGNAPVRGSNREAEMNIVDEKKRTL